MSQITTFKRQSKIPIKLGIAKADNGLRLTVNSPRLINLANSLMRKSMQEIDNGNRLSNDFRKVRESNPEIQEWIELFQTFVKLMKKINKEFDLLD